MSAYNYPRLYDKVHEALAEFINKERVAPGTRAAVTASVTAFALEALKTLCGEDPSAPAPTGILGYPVKIHERCDDPRCVLCAGGADIVFGRPDA